MYDLTSSKEDELKLFQYISMIDESLLLQAHIVTNSRLIIWFIYFIWYLFINYLMTLSMWWRHFNINIVDESSIENMLHTLHATYIRHDLYADFLLRLKKSLKEFFSQQIHSSRWTRSFAAQISTVYFLSMNRRRFISDTHAYRSRFLL